MATQYQEMGKKEPWGQGCVSNSVVKLVQYFYLLTTSHIDLLTN